MNYVMISSIHLVQNLPLVGERVKLSIELAHGDGLGVEHKRVYHLEWSHSRSEFALQDREGVPEDFIALWRE